VTTDALTGRLVADESRLYFSAPGATGLDVLVDGRRVWSFSTKRAQEEPGRGRGWRSVAWPEPIRTRLDGVATLELRSSTDATMLAREECTFGSGTGRVALVDGKGRPIAVHKWGRAQQPFDAMPREDVEAYLDFVEQVMEVLRDDCGVESFIAFGALLGAVRSGRLIGHDVDIDIGYFSEARYPVDAIRESFTIERALHGHGWRVIRDNAGFIQVFTKAVGGVWRNLDIFTCFAGADGNLYQVNDVTTAGTRDDVLPLDQLEVEGRPMPVPRNCELFLRAAYGPSWRVPDPTFSYGFNYERRRMRGWTGGLREERFRWREHYDKAGVELAAQRSDFAAQVRAQLRDTGVDEVVEVGFGTGTDALFFAESGLRVLGLEILPRLVSHATSEAAERELPAEFALLSLNSLRDVLSTGARVARRPGRRAVYARHVLDELVEGSQDGFWRFCSMVLRGGGRAYVEFTVSGRLASKPYNDREPHPITPRRALAAAQRYGAREISQQTVPSTSKGARTTKTCRMTLEWP
jgi:hypothetical protein